MGDPIAQSIYDKLIDAWDLQESSGNFVGAKAGNTLVSENTPTYSTTSLCSALARSLQFTVSSERARIQNNLGIAGNVDVSISFWTRRTGTVAGMYAGWHDTNEASSTNAQFAINAVAGGQPYVFWEHGGGVNYTSAVGSAAIPTTGGTFVAATREASTRTTNFYINGALDGTDTYTVANSPDGGGTCDFQCGGRVTDSDTVLGYYAGLWAYNAPLIAEEVEWLYNSGAGRTYAQLVALKDSAIGSSDLTFSQSATATGAGALAGSVTLALVPSATLAGAGAVAASANLAFSLTATGQAPAEVVGSATLAFSQSGVVLGAGILSASGALALSTSATLVGAGAAEASASLALSPTATLSGAGALGAATSSCAFAPSATLLGTGALQTSTTLVFDAQLIYEAPGLNDIVGTSTLALAHSATLLGDGAALGTCALAFTPTGSGSLEVAIVATAALSLAPSATLRGSAPCSGTTALGTACAASGDLVANLVGSSPLVLTLEGTPSGAGAMAATAPFVLVVTGTLFSESGRVPTVARRPTPVTVAGRRLDNGELTASRSDTGELTATRLDNAELTAGRETSASQVVERPSGDDLIIPRP